jgi:trehalose 6-phosphate phosphatase
MTVTVARSAPRLAHHWPAVEARLLRSPRLALFFDFDGTLAPFARRPEQVRVPPQIRRVLGRLARRQRVRVFVISGRRRANLRKHLAIHGIDYLGVYGWETDSMAPRLPPAVRTALGTARGWLAERHARYPGLWVEDKHVSLSVHLREVPVRVRPRVRRDLGVLSRRLRPAVRLLHNRLDAELVPSAVGGKGATLVRLLAQPELADAFPIYFGNDLSDEPAFAAVRGGLAVIVGSTGPTHAHYAVPRQERLADTLLQLEALIT